MVAPLKHQNLPNGKVLTLEYLKSLFHYNSDTGVFTRLVRMGRYHTGTNVGTPISKGYLITKIDGRSFYLHRLAWFYVTGIWPKDEIDHRNKIYNDNRFDNLRDATHPENNWNTGARPSLSGLKGAYKHHRGGWKSQIMKHGRLYFLGIFNTPEEAHQAYCAKAKELFAEFARFK